MDMRIRTASNDRASPGPSTNKESVVKKVAALAFALLLSVLVLEGPGHSTAVAADTNADSEDAVFQTDDEALTHDLGLVAKARGWSLEQARTHYLSAEVVGHIAAQVALNRPDAFVGSALSDNPGGPPMLYIKGIPDDFILNLVEAAEPEVLLVDNQPYSFDELEQRKLVVHQALEAIGFDYIMTTFDLQNGGHITAEVTRVPGLESAPDELLGRLPSDIKSDVTIVVADRPIAEDHAAFGGMWLRDDGANECTSGFSVRKVSNSVPGVTGAGHCAGINQINHPGHAVHSLTYQQEHRGEWGDVEWYTQAVEPEPDDFYATAAIIRDVSAVEARAAISVGEPVCVYGRSSNSQNCSMEVNDASVSCTNSGVFNDRLVLMSSGATTTGGDSGGPWYFSTKAFGVHKGKCGLLARNAFSVADLFDEAIGVRVATS
jgi:hypothetical protein